MSRSGYNDCDGEEYPLALWRGAVASATRGKRGQKLLRDLAAALDAMPEKTLGSDALRTADGDFCTLGVLGQARGMNIEAIDPDDYDQVAHAFGIAAPLAREIMYENDEGTWDPHRETPQARWQRMRQWVESQINREPT